MSVTSQVGIRRRLDPDRARGPQRAGLAREVVDRGVLVELDREAPRRGEFQQPLAQRPVHVARGEHARRPARAPGTRPPPPPGPRREQQRGRGALERGDQRLGLVVGRIVGARVDCGRRDSVRRRRARRSSRRGSAGRSRDTARTRGPGPGRRASRDAAVSSRRSSARQGRDQAPILLRRGVAPGRPWHPSAVPEARRMPDAR